MLPALPFYGRHQPRFVNTLAFLDEIPYTRRDDKTKKAFLELLLEKRKSL